MAKIPIKRLTEQQIAYWQKKEIANQRDEFSEMPALDLYSKILRRYLDFYWIEVNNTTDVQNGDTTAIQVVTNARRAMESDISFMVWSLYN
jgi:hypothetical protein